MEIVGATGLGGLWALEWAWQTFFGSIDRYCFGRFDKPPKPVAPTFLMLELKF